MCVCLCEGPINFFPRRQTPTYYTWLDSEFIWACYCNKFKFIRSGDRARGREIELLEQVNHALNIDLGITTAKYLCVMATNICVIIIHNYIWFTFQITCIYVVTLGKHQLKFVYELLFRLISLIKGRRAQYIYKLYKTKISLQPPH